jgi:hypothetical protein
MECCDFLRIRVLGGGKQNRPSDKLGGFPARASIVEIIESADEKAGACEQNHGERELGDDEDLTEALMAAPARRAAPATL